MVRAASYPEIGIDSPASVSVRGIRGESGRHGFISPYRCSCGGRGPLGGSGLGHADPVGQRSRLRLRHLPIHEQRSAAPSMAWRRFSWIV